jgi:membrane protein required for colicin V production
LELSTLDIILLVPLLFGIIKGFTKGFIRELAAVSGLILGVIAAFLLADNVFQYFTKYFENIEFELKIVSYVVVFFATILLINALASLLTRTMRLIALNGINRILGAIFGGLKWTAIMVLLVFSINKIQQNRTLFQKSTLNSSKIYKRFLGYGEDVAMAVGFEDLVDRQYLIKDAD